MLLLRDTHPGDETREREMLGSFSHLRVRHSISKLRFFAVLECNMYPTAVANSVHALFRLRLRWARVGGASCTSSPRSIGWSDPAFWLRQESLRREPREKRRPGPSLVDISRVDWPQLAASSDLRRSARASSSSFERGRVVNRLNPPARGSPVRISGFALADSGGGRGAPEVKPRSGTFGRGGASCLGHSKASTWASSSTMPLACGRSRGAREQHSAARHSKPQGAWLCVRPSIGLIFPCVYASSLS